MTTEEKQLLLKDLCARLPYGLVIKKKVCHTYQIEELNDIGYGQRTDEIYVNGYPIKQSKPYLRPISSMTEEEKELMKGSVICFNELEGNCTLFDEIGLDWLNANHFDYRGLIEKGLALEAPEGMYKIE